MNSSTKGWNGSVSTRISLLCYSMVPLGYMQLKKIESHQQSFLYEIFLNARDWEVCHFHLGRGFYLFLEFNLT